MLNGPEHPIIALWSHPRSLSTAVERVIRQCDKQSKSGLRFFHEPFMYYYYLEREKKSFSHFEPDNNHPTCYEDIRKMLLDAAQTQRVFFKDMSYYVVHKMVDDNVFANRLVNTFLIRNPVLSIASYHKLDPEFSSEEAGLECQWQHFKMLTDRNSETPVVIDASDVLQNPVGMMRAYCQRVDMDFSEDALSWNDKTPEDWKDVSTWHKGVLQSGGLKTNRPDVDDKKIQQAETLLDNNPHLRNYYEHHLPFYTKLYEYRIQAVSL